MSYGSRVQSTNPAHIREVFEDVTAGVLPMNAAVGLIIENDMSAMQRRHAVTTRCQDAADLRRGIDRLANHA